MKKIDHATVQRILDAADIVDVVSDFVSLKRRGSGYIGLCPFHNERTPSFSVSPAKNFCKCFSCGKGGSPVNFLMELEKMNFSEALRYLARKYNIEIKEREMTPEEQERESEREGMLALNDWAMKYFERVMADTPDGRDIGRAYFLERGLNEAMMSKFHLGYCPDSRDAMYNEALKKGFTEKFLVATGICARSDKGYVYDRFRGRVIYPVLSVSGKVVAFGGRTLRSDKTMAKYVNSPESVIYSKSHELYGLFQAKNAIVNRDKVYMVEGYMDVISMFQSGVENVVASSGTSLTVGQIRLLRRFSRNVTVIYDSDAAGIKASLRGIDLLLAEGMNVKVLQFPDGDDPDSFAQNHSTGELERYLATNEVDFITFKTRILLDGIAGDPIARASAISSICQSIAMIPELISRTVYIGETSRHLGIDEKVLTLQVARNIADNAEKERVEAQKEASRRDLRNLEQQAPVAPRESREPQAPAVEMAGRSELSAAQKHLAPFEKEVLRYVLKYGMVTISMMGEKDGETVSLTVLDYVREEMEIDDIDFLSPDVKMAWAEVHRLVSGTWDEAYSRFSRDLERHSAEWRREGEERIRESLTDMDRLHVEEMKLQEEVESKAWAATLDFCTDFISRAFLSCDNDILRTLTTELVSEKYRLSAMHSRFQKIYTERDRLEEFVPRAVLEWKDAILDVKINEVNDSLREACDKDAGGTEHVMALMARKVELLGMKREFAMWLGERVVTPRRKR